MTITYPEGGMPGLVLRQRTRRIPAIDTFKVQLVPLRTAPKTKIGSPEDVAKLVKEMEDYDRESAKIIHLDTKNQVMGIETISIGSLNMSIIHPRETVKGAILNNSANVIFVHNHPSGICGPSKEDLEISGKLKEVFDLVNITMLDSIIVGKGCHYSLRESGYITGKTKHASSQMVAEPKEETKGKVDFITAVTDYINSGADLERRKRSGEKIQASRYFKPWFDEFFYEHDRENTKKRLMKFFNANEQGLGVVNYTHYGAISEYLRAIGKPGLVVREATGAKKNPCERIKEIKTEQQRLSKELAGAYLAHDTIKTKKLVETGNQLRAEWGSLTRECQEILLKQTKGTERMGTLTVKENTAPMIFNLKQEIKAIHSLATKNDPSALPRAENAMKQIDSGLKAKTIMPEQAKILKEAVGRALYKFPYIEIAKLLGEKEIVTAEPVVLKTEKLGTFYLSYVQLGKEVYSEWGNSPEEAVKNAMAKAEKQVKIGKAGAEVEIKHEPGKIFPYRVVYAGTDKTVQTKEYPEAMAYYTRTEAERGIAEEGLTQVKREHIPSTVSENIQVTNNIETFLNRLTVDTSRYSRAVPIPESQVIGAAIPGDGFLFAYHVTDKPEDAIRKLRSNIPLCQMNPEGDLGCGLYVSGVPEYWRGRSTAKWEFAKNLNRAQRQALVNIILSDPNYRKGGGYLADFEVDYLNRDLRQFVETGDVNVLAMTGNQPYNVHITKEIARKAGVPVPKEPGLIKVKLQGKFINASELYSNAEILNRAQAWAVINRPKLLEWNKRASTQDIVNAWLCSMGYSGAFTKSGFSTNPEMVIWSRKAIIDAWIPEPQG